MRSTTLIVTAALALAMGSGCGESDSFGDLVVRYQIGSGIDCDEAGIDSIQITLDGSSHTPDPRIVACRDERGELLFRNIPVDVYDVVVHGLDANDEPIFEGEQEDVSIIEGDEVETRVITLSVMNPALRVRWRFDNGFQCSTNDVQEIEMVLYRERIDRETDEIVDCELGEFLIEDLFPGNYDLRVRAIDATEGEYSFAYDLDGIDLTGGGTESVVVTLEACQGECSAP